MQELVGDAKTEKVAEIILERAKKEISSVLVVGCGLGIEAAILAQKLSATVVGIDLDSNFDPTAAQVAQLEHGDATALRFDDNSFDFVYSYHALEHINNPVLALTEMKRVLKSDGGYWIGTPNKSRIVGYVGSKDASFRQKIAWNIEDWKAKIGGRFENEYGAHAGFSSSELGSMISATSSTPEEVSDLYYQRIYESKKKLVSLLSRTRLSNIMYPSVYFTNQ